MSKNSISRRHFLGAAVASTVSANAASPRMEGGLPTRVLGKTGERVSMLALGCGSRLLMYEDEDKGVEVLDMAIKAGITYLDTAQGYGNGKSESWIGQAIKGRRKGLFLATKTQARTADDVLRRADESLKRLGVDQMDLLHIHSLRGPEDLAVIEKEGVMEALYKVKERGMTRYIGFTSHYDPETLAKALTRYDVDCTQMALNAALQGNAERHRQNGHQPRHVNQFREGGPAGGRQEEPRHHRDESLRAGGYHRRRARLRRNCCATRFRCRPRSSPWECRSTSTCLRIWQQPATSNPCRPKR